jgi:hypothetical protein
MEMSLREAIKIVEDIVKYHFTVKDMNQEALNMVIWKAKESVNYDYPIQCSFCGYTHSGKCGFKDSVNKEEV